MPVISLSKTPQRPCTCLQAEVEGLAQVLEVAHLEAVPGEVYIAHEDCFAAVGMLTSLGLKTRPDLVLQLNQAGRGGGVHVI